MRRFPVPPDVPVVDTGLWGFPVVVRTCITVVIHVGTFSDPLPRTHLRDQGAGVFWPASFDASEWTLGRLIVRVVHHYIG